MLDEAGIIVVDIETYDPDLESMGPGTFRRDCQILGVAVVSDTGYRRYFNLGHKGILQNEKHKSRAELQEILTNKVPKLGHNFLYDLDLLVLFDGYTVNGKYEDTQVRESLIDAYANHYDLDTLSLKYGGTGKRLTQVEAICGRNGWAKPYQKHLYKMTAAEVEDYALGDADETLKIYLRQQETLEAEGLLSLYDMEIRLMPCLLQMRKQGVRIDRAKRQLVSDQLHQKYDETMGAFSKRYGKININSGNDLTYVFKKEGVPLTLTDQNNPSFAHDVLVGIDHPIARDILEIRGLKTVLNNYVDGAFVDFDVNGRIHCSFYPVVRDDGGTVTGRFSCKNPNLQQVPSKDEKNGPLIREIFVAEEGCDFLKSDYSQIEYRILVHYATGPGAVEVKNRFINDPTTDYHQFVCDITGLGRKYAKNLNFGTVYCMGVPTMSKKFGWTMEHAKEVSDQYFDAMPFVKPTRNFIMDVAKQRGYVRTVLNRRARLSDDMRSGVGKRGKEYKLVNYLIQGSAADIMKAGMVAGYEAGLFDVIPIHLTVHDELSNSVPRTRLAYEAAVELKYIMEHTVELSIPLLAKCELGPSWGQGEEVNFDELARAI